MPTASGRTCTCRRGPLALHVTHSRPDGPGLGLPAATAARGSVHAGMVVAAVAGGGGGVPSLARTRFDSDCFGLTRTSGGTC